MKIHELRSKPRFRVTSQVHIQLLGSCGGECSGRVNDISDTGLGLTVDRDLRIGGIVKTIIGDRLMIGVVRHCERRNRSYSAGVELIHSVTKAEIDLLLGEWGLTLS
jgi:hypothetical protein